MGGKVIHFADKTDREIGTARCGAKLNGNFGSSDDIELVTCAKCRPGIADFVTAPVAAASAVRHLGTGADNNAVFCGAAVSRVRTELTGDPDEATCPACLRAWGKNLGALRDAELQRADRMSAEREEAVTALGKSEFNLQEARGLANVAAMNERRAQEIAARNIGAVARERARGALLLDAVRALAKLI